VKLQWKTQVNSQLYHTNISESISQIKL